MFPANSNSLKELRIVAVFLTYVSIKYYCVDSKWRLGHVGSTTLDAALDKRINGMSQNRRNRNYHFLIAY